MLTAAEIYKGLANVQASGEYTRLSPLHGDVICTSGIAYLATAAECHWLIDKIAAIPLDHPDINRLFHQVWQLQVDGTKQRGVLRCRNLQDKELYCEPITFTRFPLCEVVIWAIRNGKHRILLLPGEY